MATLQCEKFTEEIDVKVSAKRMWYGLIKDSHNCLPKCLPDKVASVQYEGDRFAEVGSVRVTKFHKGHRFLHVKEKFEEVDEEQLTATVRVIEGGFLGAIFHKYKLSFKFNEGAVCWSIEYEGLTRHKCPEEVKELISGTVKAVEAYLLANAGLYGAC